MSKKAAPAIKDSRHVAAVPAKDFRVKLPVLWLAAVVFLLYLPTLRFDFTDLDDSIFIRDMASYTEDLSNLTTSFHRGVFDPTHDNYYRPLFLDSIILNYQVNGQNIAGYRFVNILLHLGCVLLLFQLLQKLGIRQLHAFLLSLLFAVHPVLSQAVIWIPGRNDSLMGVFVLSYLLFTIEYLEKEKWSSLLLSLLFLLAGFFTKETALLAPLAALLIQLLLLKRKPFERVPLVQYASWFVGLVIYFWVRSTATLQPAALEPTHLLHDFVSRLPLIVQYLGKIFLPFNLSVFPILQDTVYYWGVAAMLILAGTIYLSADKKWAWYIAGFGIFITFLLPVLLVPNSLTEQTFEHRLYLPVMGILLVLSKTVLFQNKLEDKKLVYAVLGTAAVFTILNFNHHKHFKDALSFWEQGYTTSPHSAYATMMYGARVEDKQEGFSLMRKAYALNPDEKYLNYYYGVMLQKQDSLLQSEKHFLAEKKRSGYYECDFYLAKIAFYKKDFNAAADYLETYVKVDKTNEMANNNLLLLYTGELKDKAKALAQIKRMQENRMMVPASVAEQVQRMP